MNTRQVGVFSIIIVMVAHVYVGIELHGLSHVTFYYIFVLFS